MASMQQGEWELELEDEFEGTMESEFEHHESAHELELEDEFETHESAHEFEAEQHEWEAHESHELEDEFESGEQFFGRLKKLAGGIGRFVTKAAPILRQVVKVAAPMVGTAIGGPLGGILGKVASSALGEEEFEQYASGEFELESEWESGSEQEGAQEVAHEIAHHEVAHHEALAEMMAEAAAHEQHEGEAEAMAGAAAMTVLSPSDRRALRRVLPHLVRGTAILTRVLRRRRVTRPFVRAVPTVVRRTVIQLKRQAAAGKPITRKAAGRAAATQIRAVLGNPRACAAAIQQNVRVSRRMRARPVAG